MVRDVTDRAAAVERRGAARVAAHSVGCRSAATPRAAVADTADAGVACSEEGLVTEAGAVTA